MKQHAVGDLMILADGGDMPWNESRYPVSMRNMPDSLRRKAIAIANALLEEGYDEGRAIRIAIAQARRWSATRTAPRAAHAAPVRPSRQRGRV